MALGLLVGGRAAENGHGIVEGVERCSRSFEEEESRESCEGCCCWEELGAERIGGSPAVRIGALEVEVCSGWAVAD